LPGSILASLFVQGYNPVSKEYRLGVEVAAVQ